MIHPPERQNAKVLPSLYLPTDIHGSTIPAPILLYRLIANSSTCKLTSLRWITKSFLVRAAFLLELVELSLRKLRPIRVVGGNSLLVEGRELSFEQA
jgi:hypothetical protein